LSDNKNQLIGKTHFTITLKHLSAEVNNNCGFKIVYLAKT